jgi:hypothetical protein
VIRLIGTAAVLLVGYATLHHWTGFDLRPLWDAAGPTVRGWVNDAAHALARLLVWSVKEALA